MTFSNAFFAQKSFLNAARAFLVIAELLIKKFSFIKSQEKNMYQKKLILRNSNFVRSWAIQEVRALTSWSSIWTLKEDYSWDQWEEAVQIESKIEVSEIFEILKEVGGKSWERCHWNKALFWWDTMKMRRYCKIKIEHDSFKLHFKLCQLIIFRTLKEF